MGEESPIGIHASNETFESVGVHRIIFVMGSITEPVRLGDLEGFRLDETGSPRHRPSCPRAETRQRART